MVEEFAEGRGSFDDSAEWHLSTSTSPMRVGEVTNLSAKGSVYCRGHFSGGAGVAAAFIQLDREALDLDHIVDKNRVKGPVSKVDLCKRQNQQLVLQWLDEGKVDAAMLPPPCGTSSRAREIPIIDKKGCRRPTTRPLRSQNWPDGVPSLKGLDAMKVRLANSCIDLQGGSLTCVVSLGSIICENRQRSWMWETSLFQSLPSVCRFQCIHSCMYGGRRLKRTALLMNFQACNLFHKL